jgi:hypothetical protein
MKMNWQSVVRACSEKGELRMGLRIFQVELAAIIKSKETLMPKLFAAFDSFKWKLQTHRRVYG